MRQAVLVLSALTLAACGDEAVPTSVESRQLDEADRLLNEAPANLEAVDDGALAGDDVPAAQP